MRVELFIQPSSTCSIVALVLPIVECPVPVTNTKEKPKGVADDGPLVCAQRRIYVSEDVNARMLVCENMRV